MAVVFNGILLEFSPLLRLQPAAERNLITALTRSDKLKVWVYGVRQLICQCGQSQLSYRRDRQTDGRIFSFIYRFTIMGRHTQKAKPVQGVSLTIVHTNKIKIHKETNNLQTYICTTALTKKHNYRMHNYQMAQITK